MAMWSCVGESLFHSVVKAIVDNEDDGSKLWKIGTLRGKDADIDLKKTEVPPTLCTSCSRWRRVPNRLVRLTVECPSTPWRTLERGLGQVEATNAAASTELGEGQLTRKECKLPSST